MCAAYIMRTSTEGTHAFRHKTHPVYPHVKYTIFHTAEFMGCRHQGGGTGGTTQGQKHFTKSAKTTITVFTKQMLRVWNTHNRFALDNRK